LNGVIINFAAMLLLGEEYKLRSSSLCIFSVSVCFPFSDTNRSTTPEYKGTEIYRLHPNGQFVYHRV